MEVSVKSGEGQYRLSKEECFCEVHRDALSPISWVGTRRSGDGTKDVRVIQKSINLPELSEFAVDALLSYTCSLDFYFHGKYAAPTCQNLLCFLKKCRNISSTKHD